MIPDVAITETITQQRERIEGTLAQHCGSLERYRHWTGRIIYTPGIKEMAELCGAYWLLDVIASHQIEPKVRAEEFQVWTLTVAPDRTAVARATDGNDDSEEGRRNDRSLASQQIEFTDFPLAELKLYLDQGTLMLPGEY